MFSPKIDKNRKNNDTNIDPRFVYYIQEKMLTANTCGAQPLTTKAKSWKIEFCCLD
jgi:hypothetical protein